MKRWFLIILACALSLMIAMPALAEGEDASASPDAVETSAPTDAPTDAPSDAPVIGASGTSDDYKTLLKQQLEKTVIGADASLRNQIEKILDMDEVVVSADAYTTIVKAVQESIDNSALSNGASLNSYTEADYEIAVKLIEKICDALDLDYEIDPSNDSQNEYARVITIKKNGKVLGKINSDTKTDVEDEAILSGGSGVSKYVWIIVGSALIVLAAAAAVIIGTVNHNRKKTNS